MIDRLSALDATFLELEELDEGALMSIGGTMVFDPLPGGGVPTVDDVRANLAAKLGGLPRYTQRLSATKMGNWSWPHWTEDEQFEIANHVGHAALPAPGTDQHNGLVTIGINADCESTPDLDALASGIQDGIDELRAQVPEPEKVPQETRI